MFSAGAMGPAQADSPRRNPQLSLYPRAAALANADHIGRHWAAVLRSVLLQGTGNPHHFRAEIGDGLAQ